MLNLRWSALSLTFLLSFSYSALFQEFPIKMDNSVRSTELSIFIDFPPSQREGGQGGWVVNTVFRQTLSICCL